MTAIAGRPVDDYSGSLHPFGVVRNFGWLAVDHVVRAAVWLLVNIIFVRYLGPEQFGKFNYAFYLIAIAQYVAGLGLDRIVVRDISQHPDNAHLILGTACVLRLAGAVVGVVAAVGLSTALRSEDSEMTILVISMGGCAFAQGFFTIDQLFLARYQSKLGVKAKLIAGVSINSVKIALVVFGAPLVAIAAMVSAEFLATALALVLAYHRGGGRLVDWSFDRRIALGMLRQSGVMMLADFAVLLHTRSDVFIMGHFLSDYDIGLYTAALRLVEAGAFVPMFVTSAATPLLASAKAENEALFKSMMIAIYGLMAVLGWSVAVGLWALSGQLVAIIYGAAFAGAAPLVALVGFRYIITCFGVAKWTFMTISHELWLIPVMTVAGAATNLLLNFVLIPRYGPVGAIYASLASFSVSIFAIDIVWHSTRRNLVAMLQGLLMPWRVCAIRQMMVSR